MFLPTIAEPAAEATTRPPTDEMHDVHMCVRSFCEWRLCGWFVQQKAGRHSGSRAPRKPSPLTPLHSLSQNKHPHAIGYLTCTVQLMRTELYMVRANAAAKPASPPPRRCQRFHCGYLDTMLDFACGVNGGGGPGRGMVPGAGLSRLIRASISTKGSPIPTGCIWERRGGLVPAPHQGTTFVRGARVHKSKSSTNPFRKLHTPHEGSTHQLIKGAALAGTFTTGNAQLPKGRYISKHRPKASDV
jgi:hypothetical protein